MGNPDGIILAVRDITERVRAEKALRRRNLELQLLSDASKAFSLTLDLDQVLAKVLEGVRFLLDVSASSIWLVDPETGELVCREASSVDNEIVRGSRLAAGLGFKSPRWSGAIILKGTLILGSMRRELMAPSISSSEELVVMTVASLAL